MEEDEEEGESDSGSEGEEEVMRGDKKAAGGQARGGKGVKQPRNNKHK